MSGFGFNAMAPMLNMGDMANSSRLGRTQEAKSVGGTGGPTDMMAPANGQMDMSQLMMMMLPMMFMMMMMFMAQMMGGGKNGQGGNAQGMMQKLAQMMGGGSNSTGFSNGPLSMRTGTGTGGQIDGPGPSIPNNTPSPQVTGFGPQVPISNGNMVPTQFISNMNEQPIMSGNFASPVNTGTQTSWHGHGHTGIDIGVPVGTPIHAVQDGEVIIAQGGWNHGYGTYVKLNHGSNNESRYGHLSSLAVRPGETVRAGQVIGWSGNTGNSTGPHLHFQYKQNGKDIDPLSIPAIQAAGFGGKGGPTAGENSQGGPVEEHHDHAHHHSHEGPEAPQHTCSSGCNCNPFKQKA